MLTRGFATQIIKRIPIRGNDLFSVQTTYFVTNRNRQIVNA